MEANKTWMQTASWYDFTASPYVDTRRPQQTQILRGQQREFPKAQSPYIHLDRGFIDGLQSHAHSRICTKGMGFVHWFRPRL